MDCGVFRSFEPVEWGEVDSRAAVCAEHRFLPGVWWEGKNPFDPVFFALGGIKYLKSHREKRTFLLQYCLLCEIIHFVISSPCFVQCVHCMQINMVKTMSNRLTLEKS